jgi:hypothetical protein
MMHSSTNTSSAATLPHVKTPQPASLPILHANFPPTPFPKDTIACREDESSISCRPILLARPTDVGKLSSLQVLLRQQIEAFSATERYATTHTRGRTKPVRLGQVGIRCRHCAHIPLVAHQKGSTYFPTTVQGFYQASQNMSNMHLQNGVCVAMPQDTKNHFERLLSTKIVFSGAGRKYWTKSARELGLVDTDQGIHFEGFIPPDAHVVENAQAYSTSHVVDTNCPVASTSGSQGVCNKKRSNTTAGHKPASQKRDKV